MGYLDFLDRDNDGSMLDDGATMAAGLGGAGLGAVGTVTGAAGAAAATLGGGMLGLAGMSEMASFGFLSPVAVPLAIAGAGMLGGGALLGGLGAAELGAGGMLGAASATGAAEEFGDFSADLLGTRGEAPYANVPIGDPHYASGRTDGLGQQLHQYFFGGADETPAPAPSGPSIPPYLPPPVHEPTPAPYVPSPIFQPTPAPYQPPAHHRPKLHHHAESPFYEAY